MRFTIVLMACATAAYAQTPTRFEVASVKVNASGSDDSITDLQPGGRFVASNAGAETLLELAFGVKGFQITGVPRSLENVAYDITAKLESGGNVTEEQMRPALVALLAERFALKYHVESRQLTSYVLVKGLRPHLQAHDPPNPPSGRTLISGSKISLTASGVTMHRLAQALGGAMAQSVADETGLAGDYDLKLEWVRDDKAGTVEGPSVFTAIEEQLGLKLESRKAPVDVIVVDRMEKATEN